MKSKLIIACVVLFACLGCTQTEKAYSEKEIIRVRTQVIRAQENAKTTRYAGTIEPVLKTNLSLQTTGRVVAIHVKNGEYVCPGQVILDIDSTQAVNACTTAQAAWAQAQDGYERVRKVYGKGAVTDQKMVEVESQLARAQAVYEAARQQVRECRLVAPCGGIISGLETKTGQSVAPGVPVCAVLDVTAFEVVFTVPEGEVKHFTTGERLKGNVECAAADVVLPVTVTEVGTTANPLTHTYEVKARVQGGKEVLKPGMVGVVTMSKERSETKGIVIPAKCVLLKPEGHTVWLKENGAAVRRVIAIDGYQADGVRVLNGLEEGDSLIVDGYQKLYNACKVTEIEN